LTGVRQDTREADGARRHVFSPVDNRVRVDAVVRRLGDAIELGLLSDGEQLPGETDLAGRLGVSTVTLREALMALRRQGLVVTRRGRGGGSFVSRPEDPDEQRVTSRLTDWSSQELRDLGTTGRRCPAPRPGSPRSAPNRTIRVGTSASSPNAATKPIPETNSPLSMGR
jgi:DNA-binding transcriptional regulator YhcF (GntR family)